MAGAAPFRPKAKLRRPFRQAYSLRQPLYVG